MKFSISPLLGFGLAVLSSTIATVVPLTAAVSTSTSTGGSKELCWSKTKNLLVFGDSYTFIQGTAGHANYSFIGDAFDYSFTPKELFDNEIVANWTSAGGSNWPQYLTGCYDGKPKDCPKQKLWDFAFAGADISAKYLTLHHNYTIDLDDQVRQWDTYARRPLSLSPAETLVAFFIGINDINDSRSWTNLTAAVGGFPAFYDTIVGEYFGENIAGLVKNRGFRHFVFLGLPPLHRTPGNLVAAKGPLPNITMLDAFDEAIKTHMAKFVKENKKQGVTAKFVDTRVALEKVLDDPEPWGIKNTTKFCPRYDAPDIATNYAAYGCNPIGEYFWYNSGHITFTAQRALAAEVKRVVGVC